MRRYVIFSLFCVMLFLNLACNRNNVKSTIPKTVKTEQIVLADATEGIQYPGKVKSVQDASLAFKVSGTLQRILVKDGQRVRKGELVAQMDSTDYRIQLDATEAEYKQIKAEAERVIALYEDGGTTPNNYDKAVYGLKQITAKYEHHKDQLSYTNLYAPFDGVIEKHFFEEHEIISAGMPVINMIGSNSFEVKIGLPAQDYVKRDEFDSYSCTFDVFPNVTYKLIPKSISPKANANQLYMMTFDIVIDGKAKPSAGMNTMVTIVSKPKDGRINYLIPSTAVFDKDGRSYVYLYDQNSSTVKAVSVGLVFLKSDGDVIVNSDDLKVGDIIVSAGVHCINDGDRVRLITTTSQTNVGGLL